MDCATQEIDKIAYFNSLKGRVTLVFGAALTLVVIVMMLSSFYGQRNLADALDRSAWSSHAILFSKLVSTQHDVIQDRLSRLLTHNVVDAFSEQDPVALTKYALPPFNRISTTINLQRLSFYTADGAHFLDVHESRRAKNTAPRQIIIDALAQRKILRAIDFVDDAWTISVVWPIYRGGDLMGVVEAGGGLEPLLVDFAGTIGGAAGLVAEGQLRLVANESQRSILDALVKKSNDSNRVQVKIDGQAFHASIIPLPTYSGEVLARVFVGENLTQFVESMYANTVRNATITVTGIALCLLVALVVISRSMSRLSEMIYAVRRFADGELTISVPPRGRDEVGILGKALSTMIQKVGDTQRALMASESEAQEAARAKSAFLANMTHELRTPLNAIIGFGELLFDEFKSKNDASSAEDLLKILNASRALLKIIDEILEISKIEAGTVTIHCEPFDVKRLVDDVVVSVQIEACENKNEVVVEANDDNGWVFADPEKTARIMSKIIGNATKFTRDGTVTISVTNPDASGDWVEVAVRDTGVGIEDSAMGRLFQPFSQADDTYTRQYGGAGLGLATAKGLVRLMGGDIFLESEAGQGSTFRVRIPAAENIAA